MSDLEHESEEVSEGGEAEPEVRREVDFRASAVHNLQRARKAVTPEGEVPARAQMLIQSAIAYGLLDLADAVRSHGQSGDGGAGD
jgi:hypothetical protein